MDFFLLLDVFCGLSSSAIRMNVGILCVFVPNTILSVFVISKPRIRLQEYKTAGTLETTLPKDPNIHAKLPVISKHW